MQVNIQPKGDVASWGEPANALHPVLSVPPEPSRITLRVRNLLLLIPTDPEVQDALDNFVPKESSVWSHQVDAVSTTKHPSCRCLCFGASLLLLVSPAENAVPGHGLPLTIPQLQAAAPAQRCIHPGVPLQVIGPRHVHLQGAVQPGGRTRKHAHVKCPKHFGKPSDLILLLLSASTRC